MPPRPAVMMLPRIIALLRPVATRQLEQYLQPFDSRRTRDPLFRVGLPASVVIVWSLLITTVALGDAGGDRVDVVPAFLLLPIGLNWIAFGVIAGSARGFWRGLTGKSG